MYKKSCSKEGKYMKNINTFVRLNYHAQAENKHKSTITEMYI